MSRFTQSPALSISATKESELFVPAGRLNILCPSELFALSLSLFPRYTPSKLALFRAPPPELMRSTLIYPSGFPRKLLCQVPPLPSRHSPLWSLRFSPYKSTSLLTNMCRTPWLLLCLWPRAIHPIDWMQHTLILEFRLLFRSPIKWKFSVLTTYFIWS